MVFAMGFSGGSLKRRCHIFRCLGAGDATKVSVSIAEVSGNRKLFSLENARFAEWALLSLKPESPHDCR